MSGESETITEALTEGQAFNLQLWNQVCGTDPRYTKKANDGRHDFTTIAPQYQLREATKLWGEYGYEWGMKNFKFTVLPVNDSQVLMLEAIFFYPRIDERVEFEVAGDIKLKAGDNCVKKLITSVRSKALSTLGFNADVFMGEFDDPGYVKDQEIKFGNSEVFRQKALGKIALSKTEDEIQAMVKRVLELVANKTIPGTMGGELMSRIAERRAEIQLEGNAA